MPNILVMQLSDDTILTSMRQDQDYTAINDILDDSLARHHDVTGTSGKTVSNYAPCDVSLLDAELTNGRNLDTEISVDQKQNKGASQRIIPDEGTDPETIGDTDYVVLVTDPE